MMMYSKNENAQDRREKTTRNSSQENMSPPKNIKNVKIKEISKTKARDEQLLGLTLHIAKTLPST